MEIFNHLFGLCGEFHPNIFTTSIVLLLISRILKFEKFIHHKSSK